MRIGVRRSGVAIVVVAAVVAAPVGCGFRDVQRSDSALIQACEQHALRELPNADPPAVVSLDEDATVSRVGSREWTVLIRVRFDRSETHVLSCRVTAEGQHYEVSSTIQ